MRTLLTSALCLLALQTGCSQDLQWSAVNRMIAADFPDVSTLTTDSLAARLADSTRPRPLLLDARSSEEYAVSHLPGATRIDPNASPESLTAQVTALRGSDGARPVVIYCSVGYRSARAAARLQRAGFGGVYNLDGSIFRWAAEGRPVVRDGTPVREVHPYDALWGLLLPRPLRAE